ncbi:phosphopentomutase [Stappia sp.]|uniref:phosphopentomutase n=1 Tax=Stappia sp. TaxID=1870903 RepID=UPI003A991398
MARAILCVLDSFGIGGAPDAASFGDEGANTLGHIAASCAKGLGDKSGLREGPLALPNMARLGLGHAGELACGQVPAGFDTSVDPQGIWGAASEASRGKDTPSGHWEIAGVPVAFDWGYFPDTAPTFPAELTEAVIREGNLPGILGDRHASGTQIIAELGEEHVRTGKPICYTSGDSVYQIAAHETHFGLERLYALCETVRDLVDPYRIGRVIARPFLGESAETFERSANRRDYSVLPPAPTLLDRVIASGARTLTVGKIGDIFAHQGIGLILKGAGNDALFDKTLEAVDMARDGDLVFANFVDFDSLFGHRRDVAGYAAALEAFDRRLPELVSRLRAGDLLILTADHGCDPTWRGTDHTRERVPVIGVAPDGAAHAIGIRDTFADIGETVAAHLGLAPGDKGVTFL